MSHKSRCNVFRQLVVSQYWDGRNWVWQPIEGAQLIAVNPTSLVFRGVLSSGHTSYFTLTKSTGVSRLRWMKVPAQPVMSSVKIADTLARWLYKEGVVFSPIACSYSRPLDLHWAGNVQLSLNRFFQTHPDWTGIKWGEGPVSFLLFRSPRVEHAYQVSKFDNGVPMYHVSVDASTWDPVFDDVIKPYYAENQSDASKEAQSEQFRDHLDKMVSRWFSFLQNNSEAVAYFSGSPPPEAFQNPSESAVPSDSSPGTSFLSEAAV